MHQLIAQCTAPRLSRRPISQAVNLFAPGANHLDRSLCIGGRQTRPPDEIFERGGSMAAEEALSKRRERFLARQPRRLRRAFGNKRIRELPIAVRPAANDAFELRIHHPPREALALGWQPGALEPSRKFCARQVMTISE